MYMKNLEKLYKIAYSLFMENEQDLKETSPFEAASGVS